MLITSVLFGQPLKLYQNSKVIFVGVEKGKRSLYYMDGESEKPIKLITGYWVIEISNFRAMVTK
jgi:hypothetical protein